MNQKKCKFPNGVTIKLDGVHELDPCVYDRVETMRFSKAPVEVALDRCANCGYYEVAWRFLFDEKTRGATSDE